MCPPKALLQRIILCRQTPFTAIFVDCMEFLPNANLTAGVIHLVNTHEEREGGQAKVSA